MQFSDIVSSVKDRLNLTSTEADTRIGKAVNRVYRRVTTAVGMERSRKTLAQTFVSIGSSTVTFTSAERVSNVVNRNVSPYKVLDEVTTDELRADQPFSSSDNPTKWAVFSHTASSITIIINVIPVTAFALYADVHSVVSDLSGTATPAFPESFHDVIIEGVLAEELRKMEKPALAQIAKAEHERILSDLKYWIAVSGYLETYQGKLTEKDKWWQK